jgi:hypothetical protein
LPWPQATDWGAFEAAPKRFETLGYDHVWTWDPLYTIFGDPYQPVFERYTTLAAWAKRGASPSPKREGVMTPRAGCSR